MFEEQTCGKCGAKFHPRVREIYAYKRTAGRREYLFCCYSCMRAFDREQEKKLLKSREKMKTKKKVPKPETKPTDKKSKKKGSEPDVAPMSEAIGLYACAWLRYRDAVN